MSLVVEVISEKSPNGEFTHKADWYAEQGIAEYWIVERDAEKSHDDATVHIHRLVTHGDKPDYFRERTLPLSQLEREYAAKRAAG